MFFQKINEKIRVYVKYLQHYSNRVWYTPLIGLLAAIDNLVFIIPNDGILISSSMLAPKKWFILALGVAIGSTLGAILLAALVEFYGLPWILDLYPTISDTKTWSVSYDLFQKYGLFLLFAVSVTPLMQQPAVIFAAIAKTPILKIAAIVFLGRFIKFLIMAYLGSHAPRMLGKLWGFKDELKSVGVNMNEDKKD